LIRRLYGRSPDDPLLLTFGLSLAMVEGVKLLWGRSASPSPIDDIAFTDTIPLNDAQHNGRALDRLHILSVAPLIAEAIVRVHEGRSVSELFR
jgi:branched-subunit amino acid ABC-type transport system permease component